ncbi:MAG: hypothetical protein WC659_00830 [Patescibacteria group bacterium]
MIIDSFLLSLFFSVCLAAEVWLYSHLDLSFLQRGRVVTVSQRVVGFVATVTAAIALIISFLILHRASPYLLQLFYIIFFTFSAALFIVLVVRLRPLLPRFILGILIAFILLIVTLIFPYSLLQNIFMAVSILWVGPIVFRRFSLSLPLFFIILVVFALIDTYNISIVTLPSLFSDESFAYNGLVTVGEYMLGIGDFFLGYLMVSAARHYLGRAPAYFLAALLPIPRFLIRIIIPILAGATFPYSLFMVPLSLTVFFMFRSRWANVPVRPK